MNTDTDGEKIMDQALDECLKEEGFSKEEMRAFIFRLATNTLNKKDHALLKRRNRKARHVIH
jgi:hypothetical protein